MHPVERAVIAQKWTQTAIDAQIHAMIGQSSDNLVNEAGKVFYVVLGAARAEEMSGPDLNIVRGAVNAMYEQAGMPEIDETKRPAILSGLEAARRIVRGVKYTSLVKAACELHDRLKRQHIHISDFPE